MTRYVALLRGINVNGITIAMSDLADAFRELGYTDVKTVLASGNVIFSSRSGDGAKLEVQIEKHLHASLGYVIV